jgi:hypothetical protein
VPQHLAKCMGVYRVALSCAICSTVAVLGSGAALLSPAFAPDRSQRAPRTQVVVPGGRLPEPPGAGGYEPPPQDATPRSAFRIASGDAPR